MWLMRWKYHTGDIMKRLRKGECGGGGATRVEGVDRSEETRIGMYREREMQGVNNNGVFVLG